MNDCNLIEDTDVEEMCSKKFLDRLVALEVALSTARQLEALEKTLHPFDRKEFRRTLETFLTGLYTQKTLLFRGYLPERLWKLPETEESKSWSWPSSWNPSMCRSREELYHRHDGR